MRLVAAAVSLFLEANVPLVLSSPFVRSTIPTFLPASERLRIVPPQFSSASSGCAAKKSASSLISDLIFPGLFLIGTI